MELKNFYICINEEREATVRVEAHDLDEAYNRLGSAYQKGIVELDGAMIIGADMEDVTESITHNGWYHGRTFDLELPYNQVLSESIEATASEETAADKFAAKYERYQKIADVLIEQLRKHEIRCDEVERLQQYIKANIWKSMLYS